MRTVATSYLLVLLGTLAVARKQNELLGSVRALPTNLPSPAVAAIPAPADPKLPTVKTVSAPMGAVVPALPPTTSMVNPMLEPVNSGPVPKSPIFAKPTNLILPVPPEPLAAPEGAETDSLASATTPTPVAAAPDVIHPESTKIFSHTTLASQANADPDYVLDYASCVAFQKQCMALCGELLSHSTCDQGGRCVCRTDPLDSEAGTTTMSAPRSATISGESKVRPSFSLGMLVLVSLGGGVLVW
ncbi:hypothetical protein IWQ60_008534 [Tieghemiomyces parasiticus]|uniref:Uncharacterized protein n=1 Tax=Tieghemiomyces parasiticus TaxID=78921 RepID=A0A9W8DR39_9FUNG|nr:hypothetical protein IWQ60_008534 [Tieghemiomyces parasiticus]